MSYVHLHCHTEFSLLDGAAKIEKMMKKTAANGMPAVAITDHGNMYGAFKFVAEAGKHGIKPIVGCEFYVVEDRHRKQFSKESGDVRYHQLMLAKNQEGYKNLAKLCSLGFVEGMYSKWPRIDKELVLKYHEGIIATTCCIGAEVPQLILHKGEAAAEEAFRWWLDLFGEDYYVELQRHSMAEQELVNAVLLKFAAKYNVKVIASNDSHYVEQQDFFAHDILLCINTGDTFSVPVGDSETSTYRFITQDNRFLNLTAEEAQTRYYQDAGVYSSLQKINELSGSKKGRFGFPNDQFYYKTPQEMSALFHDLPQAIENTLEVADKITAPKLKRDILLPNFPLPPGFENADDYLEYLTWQGAKCRYNGLPLDFNRDTAGLGLESEVEERLRHELRIIRTMGFAGYFLIVSDFIRAARDLHVLVGPGRGSAAGSAVAYCIGITNIDPIKYSLLFERFLNPERVSMPDIDTDFDDEGRQRVIDYVVDKYGRSQVAQIITYGSMAAKMSIKDVARALELPLAEANSLAKLVPERPGTTLSKAYEENPDLAEIRKGSDLRAQVLKTAEILEGSVRNTGIHAAGVIIAPDDITNYIPVSTSKDSDLFVTQFEGKVIEDAGMLKMDFLGLRTLSIIKTALELIESNYATKIDIDQIPLDDPKTFALYQRGDTVATFQFESDGMRKYLRQLKPSHIEDLIAMNALYRPGPLDYIPTFIQRKHGQEKVEYPHELLEPILKHTYGIMVYQEQIMQTAQIIASYSLGGADLLRRAMGKKDKEKMAKERVKFVEGAEKTHGIKADKANEVFDIMEKFAEYGFNRSHSAAYSVVAFQTAYLKANYPAEYMAAVLTHNMGDIKKITFFIEECRRMGIAVLPPDLNESRGSFWVNAKGQIRFGMAAIKGVGEAVVQQIIQKREAEGPYKSIFDLALRMPPRTLNRKTLEALIYAGALDSFGVERWQYFLQNSEKDDSIFLDKVLSYAAKVQQERLSPQASLFGDVMGSGATPEPPIPRGVLQNGVIREAWSELNRLNFEKEVIGFYLSGHPLERFKWQMAAFTNCAVGELHESRQKEIRTAGIVTSVQERISRKGNKFMVFMLEDFNDSAEISLFGEQYEKFRGLIRQDEMIYLTGVNQQRRYDNEYELRIHDIRLMTEELFGKMVRGLSLELEYRELTEELLFQMEALLKAHQGKKDLRFRIVDEGYQADIPLLSSELQVDPSGELISGLQELGIRCSVI
ncbi:MAG: DNA polymerase III subunit alpha [Bacteroidia bacterium]|nr:DNA polymerase III subunit alpha [Bacteroidia bacterium]